ncbi:prepilin peptidase [Oceanicola sp. S124]|uniref:prepilin peptidase n=1 Tax=Oceanicola sp. S124 TaxID=1042378 RepID=UPI0002558CCC
MSLALLPDVALPARTALIFAPFVLPICAHVAWTDLSAMRISNRAVVALAAVFLLLGPFLYPLDVYGWRLVTLVAVLLAGVLVNAAGLMGAGDAKFIAAAAPFLEPADLQGLLLLFCAVLLASFATHRLARATPLRRLVPHWQSWEQQRKFPMGFPLGATLAGYLLLAILS